jgi:hypothetical protein
MANGKFVWTPEEKAEQTYVFPLNFTYSYLGEKLERGDHARAVDATLRSYRQDLKQRWLLAFEAIDTAQADKFREIKADQVDIDFYFDSGDASPTITGRWVNDFNFRTIAPALWSGSIELEEV